MAYFKDAEDVYAMIGGLFHRLRDDADLAPRLAPADTVVEFSYTGPDASITVELRPGTPIAVVFGETDTRPEIRMLSTADTAHRFWLGRVNMSLALARGDIRTEGPASKILALMPLAGLIFPVYAEQLREQGRDDLLAAAGAA